MIAKNKILGASVIGLAVALAGGAALAERSANERMGRPAPAPFDFAAADANKDGKVTTEELNALRSAATASIDADGDGLISQEELVAMHVKEFTKIAEQRAKRMLERHDSDGDGKLSAAELIQPPLPMGLFNRLDADKDGAVTQAELDAAKAAWDKRHEKRQQKHHEKHGERMKHDKGPHEKGPHDKAERHGRGPHEGPHGGPQHGPDHGPKGKPQGDRPAAEAAPEQGAN